jgi:hypothetical protein
MANHNDAHSLYVLIVSLLGTVISLPVVWYFTDCISCFWSGCLNCPRSGIALDRRRRRRRESR